MESESQKVDELVSTIESAIEEETAESNTDNTSDAQLPDYDAISRKQAELNAAAQSEATPIGRFYDVAVKVSAELGSATMPLGDVMKIGEGSVIELNRTIAEPVDIVAQGVCIAKGEVVVVDGCFAVRIKQINSDS